MKELPSGTNTAKNAVFIEETINEGYRIVWRGDISEALNALASVVTSNRLELWSRAHAESGKGFAPMAYRAANSKIISVSSTFRTICGVPENLKLAPGE